MKSIEENSTFLSRLFFSYITPYLSKGYKKGILDESDIPDVSETDKTHYNYVYLNNYIQEKYRYVILF